MGFFGFKSSKEVEEEKRQAAEEAARRVEQNNLTNLSNLSKGSQLNFAIPYFDVFDPRLQDYGVPVSVHGAVVYAIEDMDLFHSVNRNEGYSDETFKNKLRGQLTKFIKSVVSNAPSDAQIPVVQIERKIFEISELIQQRVTPQVEKLFGITIRSLDITGINVDKESRGYRELKALTADLEKERMMAQHNAQISNFNLNNDLQQDMLKKQSELNLDAMGRRQELDLGGQEELQRMNLENQRETMRIQREEMQRASRLQTEQTFMGAHQANLNAGVLNNATQCLPPAVYGWYEQYGSDGWSASDARSERHGWCASDARHGYRSSSGAIFYWYQWSAVWSMRLEQAPAARSAGSAHPAVIRLEEWHGAVGVCRQCSRVRPIVPRHRPTDAGNATYYAGDVISRQL